MFEPCLSIARSNISHRAREYDVKAVFVFNIARFTEWSEAALPARAPMLLCVLGRNPFRGSLAAAAAERAIRGHPVRTIAVSSPSDASVCHLVFISAEMRHQIAETLDALSATGVLTVGDFDGFVRAGGAVEFTMLSESLGFKINLPVAQRAKLQLSAQLIDLAVDVSR